jgi:hypothetical protein
MISSILILARGPKLTFGVKRDPFTLPLSLRLYFTHPLTTFKSL